jgi:hypothetical protein
LRFAGDRRRGRWHAEYLHNVAVRRDETFQIVLVIGLDLALDDIYDRQERVSAEGSDESIGMRGEPCEAYRRSVKCAPGGPEISGSRHPRETIPACGFEAERFGCVEILIPASGSSLEREQDPACCD